MMFLSRPAYAEQDQIDSLFFLPKTAIYFSLGFQDFFLFFIPVPDPANENLQHKVKNNSTAMAQWCSCPPMPMRSRTRSTPSAETSSSTCCCSSILPERRLRTPGAPQGSLTRHITPSIIGTTIKGTLKTRILLAAPSCRRGGSVHPGRPRGRSPDTSPLQI
jgi:hypothetical protein